MQRVAREHKASKFYFHITIAFSLPTLIDLTTADESSPGMMVAAWQLGERNVMQGFGQQVIFNSLSTLRAIFLAIPAELQKLGEVWRQRI